MVNKIRFVRWVQTLTTHVTDYTLYEPQQVYHGLIGSLERPAMYNF